MGVSALTGEGISELFSVVCVCTHMCLYGCIYVCMWFDVLPQVQEAGVEYGEVYVPELQR